MLKKINAKTINWGSEKEPSYTVNNRPGSVMADGKLFGPATTVGPNSTAGVSLRVDHQNENKTNMSQPPSVAGWPAYDGTRSEAGARDSSYEHLSAMPNALFAAGTQPTNALPEYRPPGSLETRGLQGSAANPLEAHPGVMIMGPPPVTPPAASKWPAWRNSVATVSSLASVPRFRTIKSWVGDQRNRTQRHEEVPDVPDMPVGRYSRLE